MLHPALWASVPNTASPRGVYCSRAGKSSSYCFGWSWWNLDAESESPMGAQRIYKLLRVDLTTRSHSMRSDQIEFPHKFITAWGVNSDRYAEVRPHRYEISPCASSSSYRRIGRLTRCQHKASGERTDWRSARSCYDDFRQGECRECSRHGARQARQDR